MSKWNHFAMILNVYMFVLLCYSFNKEKCDLKFCHFMKSQKLKSQKLHVPILEINRKNLHPQKKPVIRYVILISIVMATVKNVFLNSTNVKEMHSI